MRLGWSRFLRRWKRDGHSGAYILQAAIEIYWSISLPSYHIDYHDHPIHYIGLLLDLLRRIETGCGVDLEERGEGRRVDGVRSASRWEVDRGGGLSLMTFKCAVEKRRGGSVFF